MLNELSTEYDKLADRRKKLEDECKVLKDYIEKQVSTIQNITKDIEDFRSEYKKRIPAGAPQSQQQDFSTSLSAQQTVPQQQRMYQQPGNYQPQPAYQPPVPQSAPEQPQPQETQEQVEEETANLTTLEAEDTITHPCNVSLYAEIIDQSVICSTAFSPDGVDLAIGADKVIRVYNLEQDKFVLQGETVDASSTEQCNHVRSISWMPDSKRLLCGLEDHSIYVYDVDNDSAEEIHKPKKILKAGDGEVYQVLCFPDGSKFASLSDGKVQIWDANTYQIIAVYQRPLKEGENKDATIVATSLSLAPNGDILAVGYSDFYVSFWKLSTGEMILEKKCHEDGVYSVLFTPDGKRFITSSLDHTIKLWNITSNDLELWKTLDKHTEYVLTLAIDPTGQWLLSGSKDMSCIITRLDEGRMLYKLTNHVNSVITVSFNPNGKLFCTGSGDKYVKIWNFLADEADEVF